MLVTDLILKKQQHSMNETKNTCRPDVADKPSVCQPWFRLVTPNLVDYQYHSLNHLRFLH